MEKTFKAMPIYVYQCPECDYVDEVNRSFDNADKPIYCSKCGEEANITTAMKRLIGSNVGILFKGPGFYSTDNSVERIPRKVTEWH